MTQILLTLNDKELRTILRAKLAQVYGAEVIIRDSAHEAISLMQILPIDIVFCSDVIEKEQASSKISDFLQNKDSEEPQDTQLIIVGENKSSYKKSVTIGKNIVPEKMINYVGYLLGKNKVNVLLEEEILEQERIKRAKLEFEKAEQERLEREALERIEKELAAKQALVEKAEKKRAMEERIQRGLARAAKIEQEKAEKARIEQERVEKERLAIEKAKLEREEKEKQKRELLEKERLERELRERQLAEKVRLEFEIRERERREAEEKALKEKLQQEEKLRREQEIKRLEQEKIAKEQAELARIEKERQVQERIARAKARIEKVAREKAEQERVQKEKEALEAAEKEKARLEKAEKDKAARERALRQVKAAQEKAAQEKAAQEKAAQEKAAQEKAAQAIEEGSENEKTTVFKIPANFKAAPPPAETPSEIVSGQQFISINTIYFLSLNEAVLDFSVYIRIKKGGEFEYKKKIDPNVKFQRSDIERILVRSANLYVSKEEYSKANSFLCERFLKRFEDPELTYSERMKLNSESFEILFDLFKTSAFDQYNVEIIKDLIKSFDLMMKAPNAVPTFINAMITHKLFYGFVHANFTLYFLLQIVDQFAWSKDQSKNKLLYLCLFHDLNLHSDRLLKLHHNFSKEKKSYSELSDEDKQIIANHADAAAHALETIVKAPKELASLIREHHGMKSGKGFVEGLSIAISPTGMAFIVIEDFVTQYLSALDKIEGSKAMGPTEAQLNDIFVALKSKFEKHTYKDVALALEKFIKGK